MMKQSFNRYQTVCATKGGGNLNHLSLPTEFKVIRVGLFAINSGFPSLELKIGNVTFGKRSDEMNQN